MGRGSIDTSSDTVAPKLRRKQGDSRVLLEENRRPVDAAALKELEAIGSFQRRADATPSPRDAVASLQLLLDATADPAARKQLAEAIIAARSSIEDPVQVLPERSNDFVSDDEVIKMLAGLSKIEAEQQNDLVTGFVFEDRLVSAINAHPDHSAWKDDKRNNNGADIYITVKPPTQAMLRDLGENWQEQVFWRDGEPWRRDARDSSERRLTGKAARDLRKRTQRVSCKTDDGSIGKPDRFDFELLHSHPFGPPIAVDREGEIKRDTEGLPIVDRKAAVAIVNHMLAHIDKYDRMMIGRLVPIGDENRVDVLYKLCELPKPQLEDDLDRLQAQLRSRKSLATIERETDFRFHANKGSLVISIVDPAAQNMIDDELPLRSFSLSRKAEIYCRDEEAIMHRSFRHRVPLAHAARFNEAFSNIINANHRRQLKLSGQKPGRGTWSAWMRAKLPTHESAPVSL